jgi:hypothetical protein
VIAALTFLIGVIVGGFATFVMLTETRRRLNQQKRSQESQREELEHARQAAEARQREVHRQTAQLEVREQESLEHARQAAEARQREIDRQTAQLKAREQEFEARLVSYKELQDENALLKRDLQNIDVDLRKLQLDRELQRERQATLDQRAKELGKRYLSENVKWVGSSLTANNFGACKQRLQTVIERCRGIGFDITPEEETGLLDDLKNEFEKAVRAAIEREEQARIKAQIREERQLEREIERELKRLEVERAAIQAALEKALAEAKEEHSEEVERLEARLAEAEEKSQRAMSRAQMTKSGHVYVLSNVGSFGDGVFKVGMTRRLEPAERVKELGDASVPFPFDVHMMISSDDAPKLENALHRALHKLRLNKIKPRKEFFRTDIEAIRQIVEENHGEVEYVADAEALEYHQSLTMSEEDSEFVEGLYAGLSDEDQAEADDE